MPPYPNRAVCALSYTKQSLRWARRIMSQNPPVGTEAITNKVSKYHRCFFLSLRTSSPLISSFSYKFSHSSSISKLRMLILLNPGTGTCCIMPWIILARFISSEGVARTWFTLAGEDMRFNQQERSLESEMAGEVV